MNHKEHKDHKFDHSSGLRTFADKAQDAGKKPKVEAMGEKKVLTDGTRAIELVDNIQRLKLDVQRIVPVHYPADSRVVTMAELLKWVGRT